MTYAASVCTIECTVTPATVFVVGSTPMWYRVHTLASCDSLPTPQRHCGTSFHLATSCIKYLRALPRTLTLTATIAGREPAGKLRTTSLRWLASSGQ